MGCCDKTCGEFASQICILATTNWLQIGMVYFSIHRERDYGIHLDDMNPVVRVCVRLSASMCVCICAVCSIAICACLFAQTHGCWGWKYSSGLRAAPCPQTDRHRTGGGRGRPRGDNLSQQPHTDDYTPGWLAGSRDESGSRLIIARLFFKTSQRKWGEMKWWMEEEKVKQKMKAKEGEGGAKDELNCKGGREEGGTEQKERGNESTSFANQVPPIPMGSGVDCVCCRRCCWWLFTLKQSCHVRFLHLSL